MRLHLLLLPLLVSALVFSGCGAASRPAGAGCETADQCGEGLSCLDFSVHAGESCSVVGKSCSVACTTDTDCAGLGEVATFKCFRNCDETSSCGQAGN